MRCLEGRGGKRYFIIVGGLSVYAQKFPLYLLSIFFPFFFPSLGVPEFVEFPEGNREGWGRGGVACFLIMFPFEGDSFRSGDYTEVERGLGVVERFFICGRSHEEAKMWNSIIGILVTIFRKLFFVFFPIEIKKKEKKKWKKRTLRIYWHYLPLQCCSKVNYKK